MKSTQLQTMPLRFRVWDKQKHKMATTDLSVAQLVDFLNKDWQHAGWNGTFSYSQFEITQDTGLKDMDGKSIYMGDVIELPNFKHKIPSGYAVVQFSDGYVMFHDDIYDDWYCLAGDTCRVAGTIWQNGDLLNA